MGPVGQLIYTPDGFMSVSLMKSGRASFKTSGLFDASAPEKASAAESYVSYAGSYEILGEDKVIHHVDLSLFPNWVGTAQERFFAFDQGKLLLYTRPFTMDGKEQVAFLIWEKRLSVAIESLIQEHDLAPHPEGGFFKETYRSGESIPREGLPTRFSGARSVSTAIYFLLPSGTKSRLHRIKADEVWHFYAGGPLQLAEITPHGEVLETTMGQNPGAGEVFQHVVRAGHWFGACPAVGFPYSFVGCTVAPGFDFADFEMASRAAMLSRFPKARAVIERLTE